MLEIRREPDKRNMPSCYWFNETIRRGKIQFLKKKGGVTDRIEIFIYGN